MKWIIHFTDAMSHSKKKDCLMDCVKRDNWTDFMQMKFYMCSKNIWIFFYFFGENISFSFDLNKYFYRCTYLMFVQGNVFYKNNYFKLELNTNSRIA